jgi:hypothetical protein
VVLLRAERRSFCAGYDIGGKGPGAKDWRDDPTKALPLATLTIFVQTLGGVEPCATPIVIALAGIVRARSLSRVIVRGSILTCIGASVPGPCIRQGARRSSLEAAAALRRVGPDRLLIGPTTAA